MKAVLRRFVLAILWRAVRIRVKQDNPYVIVVTGSVGKTSTKEAIAAMLEQTGKPVVKTAGNMATDTGIPLSLLGFADRAKTKGRWITVLFKALFPQFPKFTTQPYYVLEFSSDTVGDLDFLAKHFPIKAAVFTTGGMAHMELYKTEEAVIAEISSLLKYVDKDGYVVVNADDVPLQHLKPTQSILYFGVKSQKKLAVRGKVESRDGTGLKCSFTCLEDKISSKAIEAHVAIIGDQQLYPLIAAVAVGAREGLTEKNVLAGLKAYSIPAGRGRIIKGAREVTIIDDTANSSPEAVIAGVKMLKPFANGRRTVAILGTMNELGSYAEAAHAEIGAAAARTVDSLVAVGQFSQTMLAAAKEAGMPATKMIGFPAPENVVSQLKQVVQKNDVVYLKASQNGMRLERIVKELMEHPEQAEKLLVRQGNEWQE